MGQNADGLQDKPGKKKNTTQEEATFAAASTASSLEAVRAWVMTWFKHVMGRKVKPDETLKDLRYTSGEALHAMNLEFNAIFSTDLTTDELKSKCGKSGETVGQVAMFLSGWPSAQAETSCVELAPSLAFSLQQLAQP